MSTINLRCVKLNEINYVRIDDVINLIKDFASSEETDTKNRLMQLAKNLGYKENKFPAADANSDKHNHFGEIFMPDSCPACMALK